MLGFSGEVDSHVSLTSFFWMRLSFVTHNRKGLQSSKKILTLIQYFSDKTNSWVALTAYFGKETFTVKKNKVKVGILL